MIAFRDMTGETRVWTGRRHAEIDELRKVRDAGLSCITINYTTVARSLSDSRGCVD